MEDDDEANGYELGSAEEEGDDGPGKMLLMRLDIIAIC